MTPDQKKSILFGTFGVAAHAALFAVMLYLLDGWPGPIPDPGERVQLALKLSLLPVAFLLATVLAVSLGRFMTGAFDPLADQPPRWRAVDQRVLGNTVEQTLIFLPLLIATAMVVGPDESALLTALPVTFTVARVVFWAGYRRSAVARAPGMAVGFAINLGMLGFVVVRFAGSG